MRLVGSDILDFDFDAVAGLRIHELDARSPFGRVSTPEDVASAVVWLVSSANPYANGQKININGGG